MKIDVFTDFFAGRGFKVIGKQAYGIEDGWPLCVVFTSFNSWTVHFTVQTENWKGLRRALRQSMKAVQMVSYVKPSYLSVSLSLRRGSAGQLYQELVETATGLFREQGAGLPECCKNCGQGGCDVYVASGFFYVPSHRACLDRQVSEVQQKAERNTLQGNYLTGTIGAILGMATGILPSLITILFTERIYAALYALIPLCIYEGYKLLRGRLNRAALVISVLLSIVGAYLIECILLTVYLIGEGLPLDISLLLLLSQFGEAEFWVNLSQDALSSLFFIGLGIWIAWGRISRTAQADVVDAERLLETVMPISGAIPLAAPVPAKTGAGACREDTGRE